MDVIDTFVAKFEQERDRWEQLKDRAMEICENTLRNTQTIGIVTGRVKTSESLRKKLMTRITEKRYLSEHSILQDRLDFVGLRIALYFPSQKQDIFTQLQKSFYYESMRPFDRDWKPRDPSIYQNLFGQYVADHLWVSLRTQDRGSAGQHGRQPFEIQLRSVLMDAWAGISHDLQYKALSGHLTSTELKLLDALKGHIEVGELMLEQLYQVHQKRIETEKEPIIDEKHLRYTILDSIPVNGASLLNLGDLDSLLLVLQCLNCANPYTVRILLHEYMTVNLRHQLEVFEGTYHPLPGTVALFLLEKLLPHVGNQGEVFLQVAAVVRARQKRPIHDSRYWHSLLWLSRNFLDRSGSFNAFPGSAELRIYAYMWCTEHYHRPPVSLIRSDDNLIDCLSKSYSGSARGVGFIAELSFLGLGPTVPEYMEVHDAGHEDDRFEVMAQVLLLIYEKHPEEWIQAIDSYSVSLRETDGPEVYPFFHLVDVATWLMSTRSRNLLVRLLEDWPLHSQLNVWEGSNLQGILEAADRAPDGAMAQLLRGSRRGFHMLRIGCSEDCDTTKEPVMD